MAILKAPEVRAMTLDERADRLKELREELMHERGVAAMGGSPPSPGKIRQLRTAIARIHTINRMEELGQLRFTRKEEATGAAADVRRRRPSATASKPKPAPKKAPAKESESTKSTKKAPKKKAGGTTKTTKKNATKKASGGKTGGNE
jgi:large subunit ribosomal protein L29